MAGTFAEREIGSGLSTAAVASEGPGVGQWRAFLRRERLAGAPPEFETVVEDIGSFLLPLLAELADASYAWAPGGPWKRGDNLKENHQLVARRALP